MHQTKVSNRRSSIELLSHTVKLIVYSICGSPKIGNGKNP